MRVRALKFGKAVNAELFRIFKSSPKFMSTSKPERVVRLAFDDIDRKPSIVVRAPKPERVFRALLNGIERFFPMCWRASKRGKEVSTGLLIKRSPPIRRRALKPDKAVKLRFDDTDSAPPILFSAEKPEKVVNEVLSSIIHISANVRKCHQSPK